uniref:Uncharacterized protein n=1 Tax=Lepeophtheirus salmonis TaxID=72036 RepID=A0A0K2TSF1_LEPSM
MNSHLIIFKCKVISYVCAHERQRVTQSI